MSPTTDELVTLAQGEADALRPILRTWTRLISEATKCKKVYSSAETMLGYATQDALPGKVVRMWHQDLLDWPIDVPQSARQCPDISQNQFATKVFDAMYNKNPPYAKLEAFAGAEITKPNHQSCNAIERDFFSMSSQTMFLLPVLALPAGFEQRPLFADQPELDFWAAAQPRIDRQVADSRMVTPSVPKFGALDLLTGREGSDRSKLDMLTKEAIDCTLFAFDSIMEPEEEARQCNHESAHVESAVLPVDDMRGSGGLIHTDTPPRKCMYKDVNDLFQLLTNISFKEALEQLGVSQEERSDEEMTLLCLDAVERVLESFDVAGFDGWIDLHHILYRAAGMPPLTDTNKEQHKFLVPRSWPEMFERITVFFLATVKMRCCIGNGLMRITSFRHAMMGIFPSRKGVGLAVRSRLAREYFCKIWTSGFERDSHVCQVILPHVAKKARVSVRVGDFNATTTSHLLEHSRKERNAQDQATRKEHHEILLDMIAYLKELKDDYCFVVEEQANSNKKVAKDLETFFAQSKWNAVAGLLRQRGTVEVDHVIAEVGAFAKKTIRGPAAEPWMGNYEDVAAVKDLRSFKVIHTGCETMDELMVTDRCNKAFPMKPEAIVQSTRGMCWVLLSTKQKKISWNRLMCKRGIDPGTPVVPSAVRLVVALGGALVWDIDALILVEAFIKNNGTGLLLPRGGFVCQPQDSCHARHSNKVSPESLHRPR